MTGRIIEVPTNGMVEVDLNEAFAHATDAEIAKEHQDRTGGQPHTFDILELESAVAERGYVMLNADFNVPMIREAREHLRRAIERKDWDRAMVLLDREFEWLLAALDEAGL